MSSKPASVKRGPAEGSASPPRRPLLPPRPPTLPPTASLCASRMASASSLLFGASTRAIDAVVSHTDETIEPEEEAVEVAVIVEVDGNAADDPGVANSRRPRMPKQARRARSALATTTLLPSPSRRTDSQRSTTFWARKARAFASNLLSAASVHRARAGGPKARRVVTPCRVSEKCEKTDEIDGGTVCQFDFRKLSSVIFEIKKTSFLIRVLQK